MTDHDVDPRIASWLRRDAPPAAAPTLTQAIVDASRHTRQRASRRGWLHAPLLLAAAAAVLLLAVLAGTWWRSPDPVGPEPTPMASPTAAAPSLDRSPSQSPEAVESQAFDVDALRAADIANADGASGFAGARPRDIVVGGPGLVAVGEVTPCCADAAYDDTWQATIWTSRDGRRWELLPDLGSFGKAGLRAVAVNEDGLMVAAGYEVLAPAVPSDAPYVTRARLWRSTNGVDWFSAPSPAGDVHDIAAWRGGWVAVGNRDDDAIVATSADGDTWTTHVIGPGIAEHVTVDAAGTIAAGGCMLAPEAGGDGCVAGLATSADGTTWNQQRIDGTVRGIAAGPEGGFVAVGGTDRGSTAWATGDGITWEAATYEDSAADGFTAIGVDANGVIAAEASLDPGDPLRVWHSFDGQTWGLMFELEPSAGEEVTATALAFRDAQYVVLGTDFTDALVPVAWHGP